MRFNIELFDIYFEKKGRSWLSFIEINYGMPLLYLEWGQGWKIQFSFLFGLIKNYQIMKNKRLEFLSDEVRRGNPIDMMEAVEVIEYQMALKKLKDEQRKIGVFKRLLNLFK